jgi:transcriptional regulator with XRE-family HTH domain
MTQTPWAKSLNRMVGERLQRLRKSVAPKPLTQSELADRTERILSRSSIASIETGLQGISLAQLYALAQALGVETSALLPPREEVIQRKPRTLDTLGEKLGKTDRAWIQRVQQAATSRRGDDDA